MLQENMATSFEQVMATTRAVLTDQQGVCDDGLWGAFRPQALRLIRTDAGIQTDIDTCWEFLTRLATSRATLRSQQILEVASAASSVERWAARFWQFPAVYGGGGRLPVWRLPMATKPHSMEIAEHTAYALLQRCHCPEAAKAWLNDAPSVFRCRLHDISSGLAPQLRGLLEKAPESVSNWVQDSVTPANELAAAGASALLSNSPMPCSEKACHGADVQPSSSPAPSKAPISQEEASGAPPTPSQAAGCSQITVMEPDATQYYHDTDTDEEEDETQCYDHGMKTDEADEASCSSLPTGSQTAAAAPNIAVEAAGVTAPAAGVTAPAAAVAAPATLATAEPSATKAEETEAEAMVDVGVVAAGPTADVTPAGKAASASELTAGHAVVMAPPTIMAPTAHVTLAAPASSSEASVAPVIHAAYAATPASAALAAPVAPVMFAVPAVLVSPSFAAGHGTHGCSPMHPKAEVKTPTSPPLSPPIQVPEASTLPMPRWMASTSNRGSCLQTSSSMPAASCRTWRRLSSKQPDPRRSFPSKLSDTHDVGRLNLCDTQRCSTPQGPQSSGRKRSTPRLRWSKASPPIVIGRQNNATVNDIKDITLSQEHACFRAAFDSDTPKQDVPAVGEFSANADINVKQSSKPCKHGHQAGKDASLFMGHTLSPLQQGQRVAVVGDGWGQCLGKSGYEAIITEADDYTYTVVALSGDCPWSETHVLKQYCVLLDRQMSSPMLGQGACSSPDHCNTACNTNKSGSSVSSSTLVSGVRQKSLKHSRKAPLLKRQTALSRKSAHATKRR